MSEASKLYAFFAAIMAYPSHEMRPYFDAIDEMLAVLPSPERQKWQSELTNLFLSSDWCDRLQIEYTRLFINDKTGPCAPLYGSAYLDGSLMGQSVEAVKAWYLAEGFEFKALGELPDHLCTELYFLSLLANKGKQDAETNFLERCFRPWFSQLKRKVDASHSLFFYPMILSFINTLTSSEDE